MKPCGGAYGVYGDTSPGLPELRGQAPSPAQQRTLPHAHSTQLKCRFPLKLNSCHPRALGCFASVAA